MRIINPFRRIGGRIFISFTILLVSLTFLMGLIGLEFVQKTISSNAANELRLLSVVLSRQVQRQLLRIEEGLTSMENHGVLISELRKAEPDRVVIEDFLQRRLKMLPLFEDLAVFNKQGVCIGSTDPAWYEFDAKQKVFFVNGLKNFNFSDIFTADQRKIQLVSTPISNGSSVKGVLVGQVNMSTIYDLLDQKLGVTESADAFLLDSALRFITPGKIGIDRLLESHLIATPLSKHLKEEFWVDRYRNFNGEEVLGTVTKIPGRRWYVVVEKDLAQVTKPINDAKRIIFVVTGVLLFALIVVTFFVTRSITRPLMILVGGAQRLAKGDFKQPFTIPKGIDEVAFLASEFDKMRARIAAFQESLMERLEESEKKRIESERLAAIGTLAATMAHEIRNPLNGMSLLVSRLEYAPAGLPSAQNVRESVLRDLRGEIGRLDRLVSDILEYARPLNLQLKSVPLRPLVEKSIELCRGKLEAKGLRCHFNFPASGLALQGDPDKLKQCFVNLLQNAIDAAYQGGTIEIEAREHGGPTGNWAELYIRDDGVGLPREAEGRLFDLFFTTKEQGTGLGLSTVKKIVDAHGGQISLTRREPKGTEVRLGFPLKDPA